MTLHTSPSPPTTLFSPPTTPDTVDAAATNDSDGDGIGCLHVATIAASTVQLTWTFLSASYVTISQLPVAPI